MDIASNKVGKGAVDDAAHGAATSPLYARPAPTEGQRSAGNYKLGHVRVSGLNISIENPMGSHRRPQWPALAAHYGYIRCTEGADGEYVDVFVRDGIQPDYDGPVFVIDQVKPDGLTFDEHKVMLGWPTEEEARSVYVACYQIGWTVGPITEFTLEAFKLWLTTDTTWPIAKRRTRIKRTKTTSNVEKDIAPNMARTKTAVFTALKQIERRVVARATKHLKSKFGKADPADDNLPDGSEIDVDAAAIADSAIDGDDFQLIVDALTPELQKQFEDSGYNLLTLVNVLDNADITNQMDQGALDYAKERAAELVGKHILEDGSIVDNPNADWAIDESTRDMLQSDIADAVESGASADELARTIQDSQAFSDARASMIARTELAFSAMAGHMAAGVATDAVGKAVLLGSEHDLDEPDGDECDDAADDGVIGIDENFSTGDDAPPFHPNACFEGTSFVSYGIVRQMVRAQYRGPAISLAMQFVSDLLDLSEDWWSNESLRPRSVYLTIGPNHPMLTRRGFVPAGLLCRGDELLYQRLPDDAGLFEEVFDGIAEACGRTNIPGARDYFHGDEVCTHGDVDVVLPQVKVQPVLYYPGANVQALCKCPLSGAYPDATHLAYCHVCAVNFDRVFLAASRVSERDDGSPAFECVRLMSCRERTFEGVAFDASTTCTIYNAGGLVVKNCVCDIELIYPEDERAGDLGGDTTDDAEASDE